jgi:hypothetical protein
VLLNKSNIAAPSDSYDMPADYPSLFEKLWHASQAIHPGRRRLPPIESPLMPKEIP